MLNRWQTAPLVLAGLWTPSIVRSSPAPPVQVAVDVAETLDEEGLDPLLASEPAPIPTAPGGLQYLKSGLLNEDEALKLILQGKSWSSRSSSQTASPVGTPSTPISSSIAVRVVKKPTAKKPEKADTAIKDVESRDHLSVAVQKSPSGGSDLSLASSGNTDTSANETLYLSAVTDHSFDGRTSSSDVITTSASEKNDDSDSEVEDSIYAKHRISFQEDADGVTDGIDGGTVEATKTTISQMTETPLDAGKGVVQDCQISCKNSFVSSEDGSTSSTKDVVNNNINIDNSGNNDSKATRPDVVTMFRKSARRQALKSTSSCSSVGSLSLAVPHLAGFIESWNPFGSGRFFDTPPRNADGDKKFGFSLKADIAVGALSEAESQELMKLFDQVIGLTSLAFDPFHKKEADATVTVYSLRVSSFSFVFLHLHNVFANMALDK